MTLTPHTPLYLQHHLADIRQYRLPSEARNSTFLSKQYRDRPVLQLYTHIATPTAHTHNASRDESACARLPGPHSVRTWCFLQYLHIHAQGDTKGPAAHCQQAYGLVSIGMVLPHGSHRYTLRICFFYNLY